MGKNQHVVKRGNQWGVLGEGNKRVSSTHSTQADAIQAGKVTAKQEKSELVIHRPNGQIREGYSYGNDPFPPKG